MMDVTARHREVKPLTPVHIDGFLGACHYSSRNAITNCSESICEENDDDKKPQVWPIH
jgi:hypothetical protein